MSKPFARSADRYPYWQMERAADQLLRASLRERGQGEYPCHSERWMSLRRRKEEGCWGLAGGSSRRLSPSLEDLLTRLLEETPLPPDQRRVLELAREGATLTAIAQKLGRPLSTVHRWYHAGTERLRQRAGRVVQVHSRTALIAQVYREQTSPSLYHEERHCLPGREDCARDGLCRHRWYLYCEGDAD